MATETEKFLAEYKRLENVLRDAALGSVLDYGNSLATDSPLISEQLKVCRIERNFLCHNDISSKFIAVSPVQTLFLKKLADEIEAELEHVKDIMTRQKAVTLAAPMKEVLTSLDRSKTGFVAVTNKDGVYLGSIGYKDLLSLIAKKGSIASKLSSYIDEKQLTALDKKNGVRIVPPDMRADEALKKKNSVLAVIDKNGRFKGLV